MTKPGMCHDCAFRKGSPERRDQFGVWLRIHEQIAVHEPFHCHQGMPVVDGHYAPPRDAAGRPVGFALCAGYLREHARVHRKTVMEYAKLQLSKFRSHQWLRASSRARGAAVAILVYIADQELPGLIPQGNEWSERDWKCACMITLDDVSAALKSDLIYRDSSDLVCRLWVDPRSPTLRFNIFERDGFRCRYCGAGPEARLQVDHIMPRSRGGTDDPENLATACWSCNIGKNDRVLKALPS